MKVLLSSFFLSAITIGIAASVVAGTVPRPVTGTDIITMTLLPSSRHQGQVRSRLDDGDEQVAQFSPDGKRFVIVLRRGNLERNTNEYSMLLFQTADALDKPTADLLVKMASSSNRDGICKVRWLPDSQTLAFLGENPGETPQIYSLSLRTRQLLQLTHHSTPIISYDLSADQGRVVFLAEAPKVKMTDMEEVRRDGMVVGEQEMSKLIAGEYAEDVWHSTQLFVQKAGKEVGIPLKDVTRGDLPIVLSPDGHRAALYAEVLSKDLPSNWQAYQFGAENDRLHALFKEEKDLSPLGRYWVIDTDNRSADLLLNAPALPGLSAPSWAPDSESLVVQSYLPLEGLDLAERKARRERAFLVEVRLKRREIHKLDPDEFGKRIASNPVPLQVTVEEDLNTPPKIYAVEPNTRQRSMLLDLNPQLAERNLGTVKTIEWEVDGAKLIGGLYLPLDYASGRRYPLVIQTHGFDEKSFSMDGRSEWSSGYAARQLAAKGLLVLQTYNWQDRAKDHDRITADKKLGVNPTQRGRNFNVHLYEAAVDRLDREGLIDRNRVGIMGFSRTVWFVSYLLTHSGVNFRAALLTDGFDGGYFQYINWPDAESEQDNGGKAPFGEEGLKLWLQESPGFNLDKVNTAVRLEAHGASGGISSQWEWFSGLTALRKPVEYVYLPDGAHILVKPWERRASQQGAVEWFCFWLTGEEDPDPAKAEQYKRWEKLCDMQIAQNPNKPSFCVRPRPH